MFLKNLLINMLIFLISKIKNLIENIIRKLIEFNWITEIKNLIIKADNLVIKIDEYYEAYKRLVIKLMYLILKIPFKILKHIIIFPYTFFRIIRKIFYLTRRFIKFMLWFKKSFISHTIPFHIIVFNIFRFYDYCIFVQHPDRVEFFFPRLKFYLRLLPL
jgi:hypothetical protein